MDELLVREQIEQFIKESFINRDDFHEVRKNQWNSILRCIEEKFIQKNHYNQKLHLEWESFKEPSFSIYFIKGDGYKYLKNLIIDDLVWFIVQDYKGKFWIYEGKKEVISSIILECSLINEYYIVSKNYEWIICENHHSYLIGSGSKIVEKMILLNNQVKEE